MQPPAAATSHAPLRVVCILRFKAPTTSEVTILSLTDGGVTGARLSLAIVPKPTSMVHTSVSLDRSRTQIWATASQNILLLLVSRRAAACLSHLQELRDAHWLSILRSLNVLLPLVGYMGWTIYWHLAPWHREHGMIERWL